jgi:arylsulfatase A-like enzyme
MTAGNTRPNLIFIMADDLGYADLSCYGRRDYMTEHLDRLAARGLRFVHSYANSATCSATRTAMMTGRYQYRLPIGLEEPLPHPSKRNLGLPPEHPTMPSLLRDAGYRTMLVGKWHLGKLPIYGPHQSGYDHFYGFRGGSLDYFTHKTGNLPDSEFDLWDDHTPIQETGYLTDLLGDRAVAAIDGFAKSGKPFFMSLHFSAPHWPWEGPEDEAESRRIRFLAQYDSGSQKTYASMVLAMDRQIGRVMRALEDNGLADNTIVVFTSDNGGERFADTWPFTGRKTDLLEGGLRVPCIVSWPNSVRPGQVSDQVVITMDWMPTFLAAAGVDLHPDFPSDGMNLLPVMTSGAAPVPRKLYWRFKHHDQQAMRDGDWKYLKIRDNTFLFNVVDDPMERANYKQRRGDIFERMVADYREWERTMLPIDPQSFTNGPNGRQLADHFGVEPPAGGVGGPFGGG